MVPVAVPLDRSGRGRAHPRARDRARGDRQPRVAGRGLFPDRAPRVVRAVAVAAEPGVSATLRLAVPEGWRVDPERVALAFASNRRGACGPAHPRPPAAAGPASSRRSSRTDREEPARSLRRDLDYPHIPPQTLLPPADGEARPRRRRAAGEAGRVRDGPRRRGPRRSCASSASRSRCSRRRPRGRRPRRLRRHRHRRARLQHQPSLALAEARLLDYVSSGGTLVVQYNTNRGLVTDRLGPYPLEIAHDRVTDETAPVTFLIPGQPAADSPEPDRPGGLRRLGAGARPLLRRRAGTSATRPRSRWPTRARRPLGLAAVDAVRQGDVRLHRPRVLPPAAGRGARRLRLFANLLGEGRPRG